MDKVIEYFIKKPLDFIADGLIITAVIVVFGILILGLYSSLF